MSVKFHYIDNDIVKWNKNIETFVADGDRLPFRTQYRLINPKTKESRLFNFVMASGSEWDANTLWGYQSEDGFNLLVTNGSKENVEKRYQSYKKSKGL